MKLRSILLALAMLTAAPAAQAQRETQRQWFDDGTTPLRYQISVTPNAETATFAGDTTITIQTTERLSSVTMNALDLTVQRASIDGATARAAIDHDAQTLTLTPRRALAPGRHTIHIVYDGKIFDDAYGLFRVEYQDDGVTKRALATRFEPGDSAQVRADGTNPIAERCFR